MAGEAWHQQIVAGRAGASSLAVAVAQEANVWWSYLNSHLAGVDGVLYVEGEAGLIMLSMVTGYGMAGGLPVSINGVGGRVLVAGWNQNDLDTAVLSAQARGLVVAGTLRVEDNVRA